MLELYHAGLTTCSKKVRLCLAEKGLQYRSHYLDLRKFEHHQPEYLAINPNGVVPTLVDDGEVILESMLINEYLDDRYPAPALRPSDPLSLARMRVWTKMADNYGLMAVVPSTWALYKPITDKLSPSQLSETLDRVPTQERREQWRKVVNGAFTEDDKHRAHSAAERIVSQMERGLGSGTWLLGEQYTLADIDLLPYVDRIALFFPNVLDGKAPRVMAWLAQMLERSTVKATYTPSADAPASVVSVPQHDDAASIPSTSDSCRI